MTARTCAVCRGPMTCTDRPYHPTCGPAETLDRAALVEVLTTLADVLGARPLENDR